MSDTGTYALHFGITSNEEMAAISLDYVNPTQTSVIQKWYDATFDNEEQSFLLLGNMAFVDRGTWQVWGDPRESYGGSSTDLHVLVCLATRPNAEVVLVYHEALRSKVRGRIWDWAIVSALADWSEVYAVFLNPGIDDNSIDGPGLYQYNADSTWATEEDMQAPAPAPEPPSQSFRIQDAFLLEHGNPWHRYHYIDEAGNPAMSLSELIAILMEIDELARDEGHAITHDLFGAPRPTVVAYFNASDCLELYAPNANGLYTMPGHIFDITGRKD